MSNVNVRESLLDYPDTYEPIYQRLLCSLVKNRVPNGILFSGSVADIMRVIAFKMAAYLNCSALEKPCLNCKDCNLILNCTHRNLLIIDPEQGRIKIEEIRLLKDYVFTTTLNEKHKVIIIEKADSMTNAAANSLLKVLEEPTANTLFILLVKNANNLPITVLSRCHQYYFEEFSVGMCPDDELNAKFNIFLQGDISPIKFAEELKDCPIADVLDFLYRYTFEKIKLSITSSKDIGKNYRPINLGKFFEILDKISFYKKNIQTGINLNAKMILEQIFSEYLA